MNTILDPISKDEVQKIGSDLTLVVVYARGPAKDLGRYFSNVRGGQRPGTTRLNPQDQKQVADYERELENVYNTYANLPC